MIDSIKLSSLLVLAVWVACLMLSVREMGTRRPVIASVNFAPGNGSSCEIKNSMAFH